MKIKTAECLLLVAMVTSAVVMQIREHTLPASHTHAATQETAQREYAGQAKQPEACGENRNGLLPTACETRRDEQTIDNSIALSTHRLRSTRIWV
jgi:hypothetical protein